LCSRAMIDLFAMFLYSLRMNGFVIS